MWKNLRRVLSGLDGTLLLSTLLLAGLGVVMVYSTTRAWAPDPGFYLRRHLLNLFVGVAALAAAVAVDYRRLLRLGLVLYAASLLLLVAVLAVGRRVAGTQGWFSFGAFSLQPSELAKVALIVTLAGYLAEARPVRRPVDLTVPVLLAGIYIFLVLLQPDLGTSAVFGAILLGMLFVAQVPGRYLAWMAAAGAAAVLMGAAVTWLGWAQVFKPHQLQRLLVLVDPHAYSRGAGWNVVQSVIAVGSGQLFGRGLFAGPQTQLAFVPARHTDFIFSAVAEELGFLGAGAALAAFYVVIRRGLQVAQLARDRSGSLLAAGVVVWLAFHVVINVGMTLGLLPVMGIPLPLVSYGGTSLVATLAGVGLLLNVAMRRHG